MTDDNDAPNAPSVHDRDMTVAVVEDSLVCLGDRGVVDEYVARIQAVSSQSLSDLGVTTQSLADLGAAASALAAFHANAGQYFKMHPDSLEMYRQLKVIPGADGFFKAVVRDGSGQFAGIFDLQSVSFGPEQAMSLQLAMATAALRTAIEGVERAVERVEGKVDQLLALAKAQVLGQVVGQHRVLQHHANRLDARGALPATDWESVASMGPKLVQGIETLRQYLREQVKALDPLKPAPDRADALRMAVTDNQLGEALQLLVLAEDSHYLWQRLRIERARTSEPTSLNSVIESAREQLQEDLRLDGALLDDLRDALLTVATLRPLEIHRRWSRNKLESAVEQLRGDFDEFVRARRLQVTTWPAFEHRTVHDASQEVQERAVEAGRVAREVGAKALDASQDLTERAGQRLETRARDAMGMARQAWNKRRN